MYEEVPLSASHFDEDRVADLLGVKVSALRNWRAKRKGPPYRKVGKRIWYPPAELRQWLDGTLVPLGKEALNR